jgi:RNA polymerase sigma-70 factor, ECF subfamily
MSMAQVTHRAGESQAVDERRLLAGIRVFDQAALEAVYDAYSDAVYRYAWRLLGDVQQAEDCATETFSRLLKALKEGSGPTQYLKAYLFRIAHNWATDHYRSGRRSESLDQLMDEDGFEPEDEGEALVSQVAASLRAEQVRQALHRLTSEQRMVVVMKYYEDCSNEEVAAAMGKPLSAVKALQHRALGALRRALADASEVHA